MTDNVPTTHTVVITVDPQMSVVVATPEGLTIRTDSDPEKVGRALLQWIRTDRRIKLAEMIESQRPTSGDAVLSLLDNDTDRGDDLP